MPGFANFSMGRPARARVLLLLLLAVLLAAAVVITRGETGERSLSREETVDPDRRAGREGQNGGRAKDRASERPQDGQPPPTPGATTGDPVAGGSRESVGSGTDAGTTTGGGPGPTAPSPVSGALALGTYSDTGSADGCSPGASECRSFQVRCPHLAQTASGEIDIRTGTGTLRGVVVFFSHARGGSWWFDAVRDDSFSGDLRRQGFTLVQVRWVAGSWLEAAPGEDAGTSKVACRPATVVRHVYDAVYRPLGLDPAPLRCGFCVTGVSGGASQTVYPLGYYGLDTIIDAVVPVSGPPHGNLTKGCLRRSGESSYWYSDPSHVVNIDISFGYTHDGPCARHDARWLARWDAESAARGALDYDHPSTRVHFILGGEDDSPAPAHARDYAAALGGRGSNHLTVETDPTMPHGLNDSGLDRLMAALVA